MIASLPGRGAAARDGVFPVVNHAKITGEEGVKRFYIELGGVMGRRHDPCVLYTLMAVRHFLDSGEVLPWWTFTGEGKKLLASISGAGTRSA